MIPKAAAVCASAGVTAHASTYTRPYTRPPAEAAQSGSCATAAAATAPIQHSCVILRDSGRPLGSPSPGIAR